MSSFLPHWTDATLDPPGSIVVIGAGPLGIEAALYGRFLGYDVTLVEASHVAASWSADADTPLPMMPDRCLSPLALAALSSQYRGGAPTVLPLTVGGWVDDFLVPLINTDLLRDNVRMPLRVTAIDCVPVQEDDPSDDAADDDYESDDDDDLPDDFLLTVIDPETGVSAQPLRCESVIVATGDLTSIKRSFDVGAEYFFWLYQDAAALAAGDAERWLVEGRRRITRLYATLAGREDLDLYRPRRG